MAEEPRESTYGLDPKRLARLISACAPDTPASRSEGMRTAEELLEEILYQEPLLDADKPESVPAVLGHPCDEMLATAGQSIADLVLASQTDLAVLKCLRDYGKGLVRRAGDNTQRDVATVVYYAPIASALLFHQDKATALSYEQLDTGFNTMIEKPWLPQELQELFRKARDLCRNKMSSS